MFYRFLIQILNRVFGIYQGFHSSAEGLPYRTFSRHPLHLILNHGCPIIRLSQREEIAWTLLSRDHSAPLSGLVTTVFEPRSKIQHKIAHSANCPQDTKYDYISFMSPYLIKILSLQSNE